MRDMKVIYNEIIDLKRKYAKETMSWKDYSRLGFLYDVLITVDMFDEFKKYEERKENV